MDLLDFINLLGCMKTSVAASEEVAPLKGVFSSLFSSEPQISFSQIFSRQMCKVLFCEALSKHSDLLA